MAIDWNDPTAFLTPREVLALPDATDAQRIAKLQHITHWFERERTGNGFGFIGSECGNLVAAQRALLTTLQASLG